MIGAFQAPNDPAAVQLREYLVKNACQMRWSRRTPKRASPSGTSMTSTSCFAPSDLPHRPGQSRRPYPPAGPGDAGVSSLTDAGRTKTMGGWASVR